MAVKRHIKSLASTEYRALFGNDSLDLIIMFMPVEGAYISACEEDVIKEALRSKIAIVGPTTLIAIIQIIIRTWNNKKQSEATDEIVRLATGVYDQARLVSESFIDFEEFYNKSKDKVNEGRRRTENLVNKVENMRTIGGLEPKKGISEKLRSINKDN
jgi:DNA recombination protein RmuC